VIGTSRPAGTRNRGSDNGNFDQVDIVEEAESSVVYSARLNIPRILDGETTFSGMQGATPFLSIEEIGRGIGRPEWVVGRHEYFNEARFKSAIGESDHELA
jgi:hypothetical protein